jgi:type II secretory pathway pseudopilin PulG
MTLIEVAVASSLVATVLLAAAAGFGTSLKSVARARSLGHAAAFATTVMEDLTAQDYDALLAMNGNQIFEHTNAANSKYAINLTVFQAQLDLLQVRATIVDLDTNDVVGTVTTQRSRR